MKTKRQIKLKLAKTGNFVTAEIALFLPKGGNDQHFAVGKSITSFSHFGIDFFLNYVNMIIIVSRRRMWMKMC